MLRSTLRRETKDLLLFTGRERDAKPRDARRSTRLPGLLALHVSGERLRTVFIWKGMRPGYLPRIFATMPFMRGERTMREAASHLHHVPHFGD